MRCWLVASLFFLPPAASLAGPDEVTQWLMQDPLTMLDYGIYKINIDLRDGWYPIGGNAVFQWDDNRVVISRMVDAGTQPSVETLCSKWVEKIRSRGGLNADTGVPYGGWSHFAQMFAHEGFEKLDAPKDLYKNIDKILSLNCWGIYTDDDGKSGYLTITSPLLGTGYSVKKN